MKNLLLISLLLFSATTIGACSENNDISFPDTEQPESSDLPSGNSKTLVAYFSATGTTQAIAERITELAGADIYHMSLFIFRQHYPKISTPKISVNHKMMMPG